MYPAAIVKKLKVKKSKVYYHLRVMEKAGIIFRESNARPIFYRISPSIHSKLKQTTMDQFLPARDEVLKLLIGHDRMMEVNTHAVKIKLKVLEGELPNIGKEYELLHGVKRNLTSILIDEVRYTVFLNRGKNQSITIQPPAIYGKNETENIARCLVLGEKIRKYYHIHWPRIKLDTPTIASEHHQIEDPAQDQLIHDQQTTFQVGPMRVDGSPTAGFETDDRLTMKDYRLMPIRMRKLSQQFGTIKEELQNLRSQDEDTSRLKGEVDALKKTVDKLVGVVERFMGMVYETPQNNDGGPPGEWFG